MSFIWNQKIKELARLYGVHLSYVNSQGKTVVAPQKTIISLLQTLGVKSFTETEIEQEIKKKKEEKNNPFPPVIATSERKITHIGSFYSWKRIKLKVKGERGETLSQEFNLDGNQLVSIDWTLPPDWKWGYYQLTFYLNSGQKEEVRRTLLVFSPGVCFLPQKVNWGIQVPLFSVATRQNEGIGDLRDLSYIGKQLEKVGGKFLGILPLHLLENNPHQGISPYFPLDRLLWNPIYLSLEEVVRFHGYSEGKSWLKEIIPEVDGFRKSALLDYPKIWSLKDRILQKIFHLFFKKRGTLDQVWLGFERFFQENERIRLTSFFYTFAKHNGLDWQKWPLNYRQAQKPEIEQYIESHLEEVMYQAYLQWLMELFLARGAESFPFLGFDLPVGASPSGSECWLKQDHFLFGVRVGSPPDDFAPIGQNWGFPPLSPEKEREDGYSHFISLLRKNFQFARYLRIDHILGWQRLFWIPKNSEPKAGTYVENFLPERLSILALESWRHRSVAIGEDLGTVDPKIRNYLRQFGVLSTRVFYFEKDAQGFPIPPDKYPRLSLATFNTHDLAPLRSFIKGGDILLRQKIGMYSALEAEKYLSERKRFWKKIKNKLVEWGLLENSLPENWENIWQSLLSFLATTSSQLKSVDLPDIMQSEIGVNLPGTTDEYPNWRVRFSLEEEKFLVNLNRISEVFKRNKS
ncbi:MAG: 4-alpha-glucanotransferase [Candidatus Atribacteria bacterium]|nr:4-alpha-glucanotransferase [Candidatus Atribacteria bacterium]